MHFRLLNLPNLLLSEGKTRLLTSSYSMAHFPKMQKKKSPCLTNLFPITFGTVVGFFLGTSLLRLLERLNLNNGTCGPTKQSHSLFAPAPELAEFAFIANEFNKRGESESSASAAHRVDDVWLQCVVCQANSFQFI